MEFFAERYLSKYGAYYNPEWLNKNTDSGVAKVRDIQPSLPLLT